MNKPTPAQKVFVRETLKELTYALYLTEYQIDIHYLDSNHPTKEGLVAEISSSHLYFDGIISIYPIFFTRTEEQQREALVHEMCHIYAQPYKNLVCRMARGEMVTE